MKLPIQMEQLTSIAETNTRGKEMEMSEGCVQLFVGLHLVSWHQSCVFVMRGRLTIECVLTYIEGSNTHCSYHKGC